MEVNGLADIVSAKDQNNKLFKSIHSFRRLRIAIIVQGDSKTSRVVR